MDGISIGTNTVLSSSRSEAGKSGKVAWRRCHGSLQRMNSFSGECRGQPRAFWVAGKEQGNAASVEDIAGSKG